MDTESTTMRCKWCERQIPVDSNWCPFCGHVQSKNHDEAFQKDRDASRFHYCDGRGHEEGHTPEWRKRKVFDYGMRSSFGGLSHSSHDSNRSSYYDGDNRRSRNPGRGSHSRGRSEFRKRMFAYCVGFAGITFAIVSFFSQKTVTIDSGGHLTNVSTATLNGPDEVAEAESRKAARRQGISELTNLVLTEGKKEAIARCRELIEEFSGDAEFRNILSSLENADFGSLTNMELVAAFGGAEISQFETSKQGNRFNFSLIPGPTGGNVEQPSFFQYNLRGSGVTTLEMVLYIARGVRDLSENDIDWWKSRVFVRGEMADGAWVTLGEYGGFGRDVADRRVCIDVTGIRTLEIEFDFCRTCGGLFGIQRFDLVKIGDPMLYTYSFDEEGMLDAAA